MHALVANNVSPCDFPLLGKPILENSRFPRNIDIPRNIRAKLGGSPEHWGESRNIGGTSEEVGCFKIHRNSIGNCRENLELNTLGIFHQIFHGI